MSSILDQLIDDMPAGLDRAILRVLSFHQGKANAISRKQLVGDPEHPGELDRLGFHVPERMARACINELRKAGSLICSMGGEGGGYYLAESQEELIEYIEHEVDPRAMDLLEQAKALRSAAEKRWGKYAPEKQIAMF